jgi:hypothetical protein
VSALVEDSPLVGVEDMRRQIRRTLSGMPAFIEEVKGLNTTQFSALAIGYNVTDLERALLDLREPLRDLGENFVDFLKSVVCIPLYLIYREVTYQAACTEAYNGTYWTFMSLLWISLFGLLAITFRAALYPVVTAESFEWDLELLEKQDEVEGEETEKNIEQPPNTLVVTTTAGVEVDDDGDVFHSMVQHRDDVDGDVFHSVVERMAGSDDGMLQDQPTADIDVDVLQPDQPIDEVKDDLVHSGFRPSHEINVALVHSVCQQSGANVGDSDLHSSEVHHSDFIDQHGDLLHSVVELSSDVDDHVPRSVEQTSDTPEGGQSGHGACIQETVGTSQSLGDNIIQ